MDGTAEEQRREKVQAGRAKLARFRQSKTKGESSKTQKKTKKRKGEIVHPNDIPPEKDTIVKTKYAETDLIPGAGHNPSEINLECSSLVVSECWDMSDLEARLELNQDDIDSCAEDILELHTPLEDTSSSELQQELQTAVHKRDEIITQLSNNLQQALLSRKEIEEETLCLSTQIHAIQRQLQDASLILKNRSLETPVPDQDQQQLALIQSNLMDQTICMSQLDKQAQELERELETSKKTTKEKDNQIAKLENLMQEQQKTLEILQKKLEMSEDSVSHLQQELSDRNQEHLKHKMSVSIHAESVSSIQGDEKNVAPLRPGVHKKDSVESLTALVIDLKDKLAESETFRKSLHVKIEDQMQEFETEKSSWEQRHNEMVASLTLRLQHAEEIAAQDKHEKDRLNQELRDLKDNLRLEVESSVALKLQHEADLQTYVLKLQSLEEDKAKLSQRMSTTWKEDHEQIKLFQDDLKADNFRHELEDLKKTLNRVKAQKEHENSQGAQLHKEEDELNAATLSVTSMDKYLIPSCPDKVFELSDCHEDSSEYSRLELDSDFILEQTLNSTVEGNVNLLSSPMPITGVLADGASLGTLLDPESFAVYLSNNVASPVEKVEPNLVFSEDIVQKCTFLMMQLQDKEQQLQKCSDALDEAIRKWREITAELTVTQLELEKEKLIKKGYWDEQQILLEDLKNERDELRKQITEQEQLLKEVQEQKASTEEHLSLFVKEKTNLESRLCLVENELEKALELNKNLQTSNLHLSQSLQDSEKVRERECQEFDNKLNSKGLEQQLLQEAIKKKEAEFTHKEGILLEEMSLLKQMKEDLESRLQEEAQHLNAEYLTRLETSEENAREQVTLLSQEHETEIKLLKDSHDKELEKIYSDLNIEKQKLLDDLQPQLERTHRAKTEQTLEQVQSTHNMELEALRLSLNNMHTAHLELSQSNLHKEKENALVQLRETLNDKRAQEVAILQGKHQFELEHLRDQHNQALKNLRDELSQEVLRLQEHSKELELNKQKCATEAMELQEKYRKERETMQELYEQEKEECKRQHELHCQEVTQLRDELAKESLQQHEKHARELEFLQEECTIKVSELQELHMKEKEELQELHLQEKELGAMQRSQEMEQLKEKLLQETLQIRAQLQETHSQEILHLQEQHNKEKDTMEDIYVQEKQEWERLQDKYSQEMKLLRDELSAETLQQHQKHLKHMELQQEEYAIKVLQLQEQHKQEVEVMEENHVAEKQEWESQRDQYVQELRRLKEEVSQDTLKQTELHLNELEQLQEQYKKIEPFRDLYGQEKKEWEKQNEGQSELIKQLQEEITSRTLQLQEEHSKVIKELQLQHSKEMKEVQEQHVLENEEWEKKRDQHSQELDILVNQHSQELKRIGEELLQDYLQKQDEHSKLIELLKEDNSKEILCLQEQHSMEMQKMRDLHAQEREQWEKQIYQHFQQTQAVGDDPNFVDQTQMTSLLEVNENLNDYLVHQKQDQVKNLQFGYNELKIRSTEEIQLFRSQIDSSRASRQELNELKEKLIARSVQLEEIEKMKHDFEQERSLLKAVHEKEMVELRIYFEQKSRAAEETYREELKILHQRLREMNDEEITIVNSSSLALDDSFESEKIDLLQHLTDQLEHHKEELSYLRIQSEEKEKQDLHNLHAVLTVQYKEDVLNMKMDLSDKFTSEIENLKKKHCLELEQLRAKLSEEHIKEMTRIHLLNTQKTDWQENKDIENAQPLGNDYHNQDFGKPHDAEVESLAMSSSDDHVFFTQADKANSDNISPREPHHNSLCVHVCEKGSVTHSEDAKEMRNNESSQFEILQNHHTKGFAILREIIVCELEEITKRLQEKDHGLRKSENRTAQLLVENANLQKNLLGEPLMRTVSVQYKSEASNAVSNLQFQEVNLCSCMSEKKHSLESGTYVSQLQHQDKGELRGHLLELQLHSDRDLNSHLSELQNLHEKELCTLLSELLQKYQEELKARDLEHEALVQSQEALHLLKLDTLESSYLTEIQKIRDEHALAVEELELCLADRLQEKEKEVHDRLEIARVQWIQQQEQELQSLRQDLASVHLEKFQAMAGELQDAHRDDLKEQLEQQRYQLDEEKSQALDALREEVLRMEAQHQLALEELRDLQRIEVQQQTQKLQDELRKMTEEFQKQELFITELSSHRQALSTELQSKSDQQLQFQEEIELLKCQSEMLLEQQITLLKDEFNSEKKAALQVVEEQLTRDAEQVRAENQLEKDHLMEQLQEKSTAVQQLQEKISVLTKEMDASQSQMDVLVQRRERENQEGEHLVAMLQSDAQTAQQEQTKLQESCQRLLKIFTDVLKSTLITEDLICKKIGLCLDNSLSPTDDEKSMDTLTKSSGEKSRMSPDCETMTENSLMSTDEGYELSEYLCDSVLGSLEVGLENEDKIVRMSQRLRTAVERLLDMVSDSALQLEQTREMQKCFENEFKGRNQEMAQVVVQNQELLKQLEQETEEKNRLQMELHKSQGLIEGYTAEKAALEEALSAKEGSEHQLVVELEKSREQLKVLTQEPSVFGEEKEVLLRLQEVLSGSVRDIEVELLKETERLVKEKLELHCQAKKDRSNLLSQMRVLEMELEEQMARNQELLRKMNEMNDLQQQIQSLEKQLKNQRHFMDEQAVEREHERDDFQQEIRNLEEQLKQASKNHGDSRAYGLHDWSAQIETLQAHVKEKAADCNLLLQGRDHLEQQIAERNEEIDKMLMRIQELEQAALSNDEAAKKCIQLEAELQKMHKIEKELLQDKDALQQQQYTNVLQISALQSKLDEARHRVPMELDTNSLLKEELKAEREALQRKEKEAESLAEQLELFREDLMNKTEEVLQLNMQLEIQRKQSEQAVQQAQEKYLQVKDEMSNLHCERDENSSSASMQLPQALLQEKNQEIDHLNEQLLMLQQEAANSQFAEVEELRSLVEHLRSDQERLHKDKEEEVEQLHEVIQKLQLELEQLGPIRHEISDSQESLDQLGLGKVENLQIELRKGVQQFEVSSAQGKLDETDSLYKAELEAFQQQLEEKESLHITEIEVLEKNLQNLQQSNRQHERALHSLQVQHMSLQEESELLRTRVSEREEEVATFSSHLQELQDILRERNASLMETELLVQTLQEQNAGDRSELENQLTECEQSLDAAKIDLQKVQEQNVSLQNIMSRSSKEQSERDEKFKEEIQELKQLLREWEEKTQKRTEESQTQTDHPEMLELETSQMVALKEQLSAAENQVKVREMELRSTEIQFSNTKRELEELHAECDCREAEAQQVLQQLKKRDACVAELQSHSQNLGTQVKKLQEALVSQETMINLVSGDFHRKNLEDHKSKPDMSVPSMKPKSFSESLTDLSTWDSPEMVRKQEEQIHSLRVFTSFSELSIDHSADLDFIRSKSSGHVKQPEQGHLLASSTPSLSGSNFSMQHSNNTQRASLLGETGHPVTDYDSSDDQRSSRDDQRDTEPSDELDYKPEGEAKSQSDDMENLFNMNQKMNTISDRGLSTQLQRMLNMVHEESCKILELSERPVANTPDPECSELVIQRDTWQKEKQNLQETIQSLSSALAQAAGKSEKESTASDWRRELLQSMQALLESEREYLRLELQAHLHRGSGDKNTLSEKMEHLIKEQEVQKRLVLDHVLAADRSSLLSEIQDLRSQLRMAHLQNQEKLQQLQDTLTSTEERGHTKEHQLRRQVELLEYKLQQEASIGDDLKGSLLHEKERASEQYRLLLQEQATVSQLHSEQQEKELELEKLRKSQKELQIGKSKLREELESKEQAIAVYTQTMQTQKKAENQRFEEEKARTQLLALKEKALQEASVTIEEQRIQNTRISAGLSQEQTYSSNLRKELEIEQSRCKALLAQEHGKMAEAEKELQKERTHSVSLSNALTLERNMLEQLRQQHDHVLSKKEEERQQEQKLVLTLQSQLEEERRRARDLATMMEKTQHQVVHAKRQLESEVQACREETQRERENAIKLRSLLESVQGQKHQLESVLEQQSEREIRLQKERDQYQAQLLILQEEERVWAKECEKETKRPKHTEVNRVRELEKDQRIMDLQLQHERDMRRIQELQHMLADLEEQERALASRKNLFRSDASSPAKNVDSLTIHLQRLWQQLLHTVLKVKKWVEKRSDGVQKDFPNEAEVTALLNSLAELKSEIQQGFVQLPAQSPSSVINVLKRENEELTNTVSQLTKEKLELRSQLTKLTRSLQGTPQKEVKEQPHSDVSSVLEAERAVWHREKRLLQVALKHAESELGKATLENRPLSDVPNSKMQRLYRRYLRAESFRKALVYQKKYLLLLLGGFQACEKATLSLIARMGVYPSPADLQIPSKCQSSLTRFRSAVRAVIAISRLKFLVRKWHKINRKDGIEEPLTQQVTVKRTEVLQQGSTMLNSPPTRDLPFGVHHSPNTTIGTSSLKLSPFTSKWLNHSPVRSPEIPRCASQDPEQSITEYIHHLEMVQRRLGGLQNGPSPELSRVKYVRK